MIGAALLLAAAAADALPNRDGALSIVELQRRHKALTSRAVRVEGWLNACRPLSCGLYDRPEEQRSAFLSFAQDHDFDRSAAPEIGHLLVVEGVVLEHCWPDQHDICIDRAPQFKPVRIVRIVHQD